MLIFVKKEDVLRKRIIKIVKYISLGLGFFLVLIAGSIYSLKFEKVQNFVKEKAISYLSKKLDTSISLDYIFVSFPNQITLDNFYIKGKDVDTLLFVEKLKVSVFLPDLIHSQATISDVNLTGVTSNITRDTSGKFNFDFILDAFVTDEDKSDNSKPFGISLGNINLKNINVTYTDDFSNNYLKVRLNELKAKVDTFDLTENNYAVNTILIDGLTLDLNQKLNKQSISITNQNSDSVSVSKPFQISLGEIQFSNFDITYSNENSMMNAYVVFEELNTTIKKIDLEKSVYIIDAVNLSNANIDFSMVNTTNSQSENKQEQPQNNEIDLLLNRLKINNIAVKYNNNSVKAINEGIDFNHLNFSKIDFDLTDFRFNSSEISGNVNNTFLHEKSGLQINQFSTQFNYGLETTYLKNLFLQTPRSTIGDEVILNYQSKEDLTNNLEGVSIFANLANTKLAFSDIFILVPALKNTDPINKFSKDILQINSEISGKVNDLDIRKLVLSGIGTTKLNTNGIIKNAMDPSKLWVDLRINNFSTSEKDLNKVLPKDIIPNTIKLPNNFSLSGKFKGTLNDFLTDLKLSSTFGKADLKASLNTQQKNNEKYAVQANIYEFEVGKLIKNDSVGKVTASVKLNGKSFDFEKADATVLAAISSARYNSYTYKNFNLNGKTNHGNFDVSTTMTDPNVAFDVNAIGKYSEQAPSLNLSGDIIKVDLFRTGFFDETFAFSGKIAANFTDLNPNNLNGNLSLNDFALAYKTGLYPITDLGLYAFSNEDRNQISFQSQVFNVDLTGKYKLNELATHLQRNVNSYFNLNLSNEVLNQKLEPAFFDVSVLIKNDDILSKLLPDLERFKDIELVGNFNSETNKMLLQSSVSELIYGANTLSGINLNIENIEDSLNYNFSILGFENQNLHLKNASLSGNVNNNIIGYDLRVRDLQDKIRYELSGNVTSLKDVIQVALNDNGLKLNYIDWNVNPDNYLQFSDKGIVAHDFEITHNESLIRIDSEQDTPNAPLNLDINDFSIETITEMIKKDTLLASGIINGKAQINDLKNKMTFTSDLNIQNLNVLGSSVGNLTVNVDNESIDRLSANVLLTGYDNNVNVTGFYDTNKEFFDLDVNVNKLQMESLQAFSQQMISETKGFLSGNLKITGNTLNPSLLGEVKFNNTSLHVNALNATFNKIDDKILFTNDGIVFNNFSISDTDNNKLSLNGSIFTKSYRDFKFNLTLFGTGFQLVNSTDAEDNILYGIAALDVNLNIQGNSNLPKVNGNLKVTDQTDFTFVMPQYSPALQEREGIIEFVDLNQMVLEETIAKDDQITNSEITGLDVSVNIEVNKDAKIAIVLDKANNDVVKIQGEAQLTGGIDPSGKTTLVGTYEVNQGSYDMSVNLLKRKFQIQQGSTIVWTGEPTKADVDITAIYNIKAAPLDLVQQQLTTDSSQDLNLYKQKLPFETLLMMKGELLKPEISFNIILDEENSSVSSEVVSTVKSKLEQLRTEESELNKQVLALLLLNRFIGENPFDTNVNISASSLARQSVSKLLSEQLNNLASNLITGVDINFDLESQDDYSSGDKNVRTDLNIGVSKTLFNDRLKVTVGSNFGLEGEGRENEQSNNIAGDVSIEYKLSKNGRYMLRAYRVNEYQVALQGEVVETGIGFVITLDYNKFKEITKRKKASKNENSTKSTQPKKQENEIK